MRVRFLGTGGSQPIPLPTCECRLCREARRDGPPAARCGSELFLPEIEGLVDASEFAPWSLSKAGSGVGSLSYCFLTHWHADHAGGLRVLGMRPADVGPDETVAEAKARTAPTLVTTRAVYERAQESVGVLGHYVDAGIVDLHLLDEAGPLGTDGWRVDALPYPLDPGSGTDDATGFLFDDGDATLAVVADDARAFPEASLPADLDAVVFESGYPSERPDGGRRRDPEPGEGDLSHAEVLARVRRVGPEVAFLTHVGHQCGWSHDELAELALDAAHDGVRFAHDGLVVEV
ncbi:hypothetical protein BRC97_07725 [Halobacteriales archaeon QS_6_71_20]|nr:MAG: hypothetical protein BRC97_07725 [Halobacteriales archaeon QS_6_71_20]